MNLGSRGPVVIDTGVFGARLAPSGRLLAALTGRLMPPGGYLFAAMASCPAGTRRRQSTGGTFTDLPVTSR
jgi:hypothetical protein